MTLLADRLHIPEPQFSYLSEGGLFKHLGNSLSC